METTKKEKTAQLNWGLIAGKEPISKKSEAIELKDNWEELLQEDIVKINASHIEVNAIKPLINGLIK